MSLSNEPFKVPERFRLIGWSLLVSVVLNLFLVGAFIGIAPYAKHRGFGPVALSNPHGDYLVEWMAQTLDPPDADALREAYKAHAAPLKQAHDHVHQAIDGIAVTFRQDQPDPAALQSALQKLAIARNEVHEATGVIIKAAYTKVSPAGRQKLASLDAHIPPQ